MEDYILPIGICAFSAWLLSLISPWLLLGAGIVVGWKWWKKWRFENLDLSDQRTMLDTRDISCISKERMMYLGNSNDKTIRWWYWKGWDGTGNYAVPQAVDDSTIYWNKSIEIKNPVLIKHLRGFFEMGNEWPAYYKLITKQKNKKIYKRDKSKKSWVQHPTSFAPETIKAVESDLPRADYADAGVGSNFAATATISALDQTNTQLLDLQETVKELEQEIKGRCPTLDIKVDTK